MTSSHESNATPHWSPSTSRRSTRTYPRTRAFEHASTCYDDTTATTRLSPASQRSSYTTYLPTCRQRVRLRRQDLPTTLRRRHGHASRAHARQPVRGATRGSLHRRRTDQTAPLEALHRRHIRRVGGHRRPPGRHVGETRADTPHYQIHTRHTATRKRSFSTSTPTKATASAPRAAYWTPRHTSNRQTASSTSTTPRATPRSRSGPSTVGRSESLSPIEYDRILTDHRRRLARRGYPSRQTDSLYSHDYRTHDAPLPPQPPPPQSARPGRDARHNAHDNEKDRDTDRPNGNESANAIASTSSPWTMTATAPTPTRTTKTDGYSLRPTHRGFPTPAKSYARSGRRCSRKTKCSDTRSVENR